MQSSSSTFFNMVTFPESFVLPLKIIPQALHNRALATVLNRVFTDDLNNNELEFLNHKLVSIEVHDLELTYHLTLCNNRLQAGKPHEKSDLTVRSSLFDFMSLASQQEDPDTLVFQRRLVMEGDTELGLALKNYLDALDIDSSRLLSLVKSLSSKAITLYKQ